MVIIIDVLTFYSNLYARALNNSSYSMEHHLTTVLCRSTLHPYTAKLLAEGLKQTLHKENAFKAGREVASFSLAQLLCEAFIQGQFYFETRINSLFTAVI